MPTLRRPRLSPLVYRRITLVAAWALAAIIVTGGAVRLTGSGLGCPQWPTCDDASVVTVDAADHHKTVESVNRTITGAVSVAVIVAVLGSLWREPRRRDLTWLSGGLVVGVLGQIVLGGLTVIFDLKPQLVMAHFLLSMVLLANAVILHHRAGEPDGARRRLVGRETLKMARLALVSASIAIFVGTVVTSSGPHGGDEDVERFDFAVHDVARAHGVTVILFLLLTLALIWRLRADRVPLSVLRRAEVVLAVSVAQAVLGYVQYLTDVPALLVGIHIAGAAAVWAAVVRLYLSLHVVRAEPHGGGEALDAGDDGHSAVAEGTRPVTA